MGGSPEDETAAEDNPWAPLYYAFSARSTIHVGKLHIGKCESSPWMQPSHLSFFSCCCRPPAISIFAILHAAAVKSLWYAIRALILWVLRPESFHFRYLRVETSWQGNPEVSLPKFQYTHNALKTSLLSYAN